MEGNSAIIIKYLEGRCTPEELSEVERLKSEDANFSEEIQWYQLAFQAVELGAKERRRQELLEIASQEKTEAKRINLFNRQNYWYAAAAAIALLLMVYVFVWPDSRNQGISSEDLLAITTPVEVNDAARGETGEDSAGLALYLDSLIDQANSLNSDGACENAQILWEEIADKSSIDEYRLSNVLCFLKSQKSSQALEILAGVEEIQQQKGEDAENIDDLISWFKIIAYMQQYEKGEEVKDSLKAELLNYQEAGYFQHQARVKEILESL